MFRGRQVPGVLFVAAGRRHFTVSNFRLSIICKAVSPQRKHRPVHHQWPHWAMIDWGSLCSTVLCFWQSVPGKEKYEISLSHLVNLPQTSRMMLCFVCCQEDSGFTRLALNLDSIRALIHPTSHLPASHCRKCSMLGLSISKMVSCLHRHPKCTLYFHLCSHFHSTLHCFAAFLFSLPATTWNSAQTSTTSVPNSWRRPWPRPTSTTVPTTSAPPG